MANNIQTDFSTKQPSDTLMIEILEALKNIKGWGSVEIYVQDHKVTQITERKIKKTQLSLKTKNGS